MFAKLLRGWGFFVIFVDSSGYPNQRSSHRFIFLLFGKDRNGKYISLSVECEVFFFSNFLKMYEWLNFSKWKCPMPRAFLPLPLLEHVHRPIGVCARQCLKAAVPLSDSHYAGVAVVVALLLHAACAHETMLM